MTNFEAQKDIASTLDMAANRCHQIGANPATRKQVWYIAGLMLDAGDAPADWGYGAANTNALLTVRKASGLIDQLKSH